MTDEALVAATTLFPLGIATGRAHCNRDTERQNLKEKVFIPSIEWRLSPRHMQDMDLELRGKNGKKCKIKGI